LYGPPSGGKSGVVKLAKPLRRVDDVEAGDEEDDAEEFEVPRRRRAEAASAAKADPWGKGFEGVIPNMRRRYEEGSWAAQDDLEPFRTLRECPACKGQRLKPESLAVHVKGRGIADYVNLPISEALAVFEKFELTEREALIATRVLREIRERITFLNDVGVGYLTL